MVKVAPVSLIHNIHPMNTIIGDNGHIHKNLAENYATKVPAAQIF